MSKTENPANVGRHAFEIAGLGRAPFRFVGASENVITYPDGTQKSGGSCDYCGTSIRTQCHIRSADGINHKVGCNCIEKVGDKGLLKAYKTSPEFRAKQRAIASEKAAAIHKQLSDAIEANCAALSALPHPQGFIDYNGTGKPLTALDWAKWMFNHCGNSGRAATLNRIKTMIAGRNPQ